METGISSLVLLYVLAANRDEEQNEFYEGIAI